jgi:hypothetical protein
MIKTKSERIRNMTFILLMADHIYSIRLKLVINFKTHITYIGNRIQKEQGKGIIKKTTESIDKSKWRHC